MLWLSNKTKLIKNGTYGSVSEFYVTFIKDNENYKEYLDKINNKKIMNIKIDEMQKLYELLNELYNAITKYTKDSSNFSGSNLANKWEEQSNQFVDKKSKIFEDEYYCDVLLTLKNAYEKFKNDNNNPSELPKLKEIEEINDCKKLCKEATNSCKVISVDFQEIVNGKKYFEKGEDTLRYIDVVKNAFETYVNEQLKKDTETSTLGKGIPEQKCSGGESLSGKENSSETSSPSSTEQTRTSQLPQESSEKGSYNQKNDQEEPQKSIPKSIVRPGNPETEVTGNETEIGDNVLKKYKEIGISIIVFLIPIALAIMYNVNKTKKTV
ncbi:PIR protein [Plasmodium yoelii yoelii]|uniref:PIR protein n=1 Tax=Plasmodium yoelii yoelii TaxID=73239 RepID=A0AAE9WXJ9_PLAYO|nr:PIR protein [Plasmodium yoelii yoelii]